MVSIHVTAKFLETTIIYFTAPIDTVYNLGSTNLLLNDYCNDRMAIKIAKLNCGALHYDKQDLQLYILIR